MPRTVTVTLDHDLGKEEARRRIDEGVGKLKGALSGGGPGVAMMTSFAQEWTSEDQLSFNASGLGQRVDGKIDVFPQHVRIEATLPGVLASIAELITGKLQKEGRLMLEQK